MKCEVCGGKEDLKAVCSMCFNTLRATAYPEQKDDSVMAMFAASPVSSSSYVRRARRDMKLNQVQFASKLGVNPITVAKWETNKAVPSEKKIRDMLALTKSEDKDEER